MANYQQEIEQVFIWSFSLQDTSLKLNQRDRTPFKAA